MAKKIVIEHVPGYSSIDHVGEELAEMARREFEGRPQTLRSADAAIRRARRRARALAMRHPESYGVFRRSLPFVRARVALDTGEGE